LKKTVLLALLVAFLGVIILPLIIARFDDTPRREYRYPQPDPSRYREVRFENPEARIELAGMLFLPEGNGPCPAAVIVHGSGPSRRDNGWYLTLTHYLQDAGIAVLLPDKRGSEKSAGDWRSASMEDLATDARAAIEFLRDRFPGKFSRIGVIGLSQGGWIAPIVAANPNQADYLVSLVGSTLPAYDVLVYEETHNLREMGFLPGVSDGIARLSTFVLVNFSQKDFWEAVGNFDPMTYWRQVTVPALALFGGDDTNVPSQRSAALLRSLGRTNIEVIVFEGSGHALQDPPSRGDDYIRQDALNAISDFIENPAH
jgi:dipeptidyl aminopeptidase/acylaminoacyl peptidase